MRKLGWILWAIAITPVALYLLDHWAYRIFALAGLVSALFEWGTRRQGK